MFRALIWSCRHRGCSRAQAEAALVVPAVEEMIGVMFRLVSGSLGSATVQGALRFEGLEGDMAARARKSSGWRETWWVQRKERNKAGALGVEGQRVSQESGGLGIWLWCIQVVLDTMWCHWRSLSKWEVAYMQRMNCVWMGVGGSEGGVEQGKQWRGFQELGAGGFQLQHTCIALSSCMHDVQFWITWMMNSVLLSHLPT